MTKLIETFSQMTMKTDWKTQYIRYRLGRLKHQYWLLNRKNPDVAVIDSYDYSIIKNCQPGTTVFFASAGQYIADIFPEVKVIEMHPVVKTFYPDAYICENRDNLGELPFKADNFAVVNNRGDHWVTTSGLTDHLVKYCKALNNGARLFYSFRDTQILNLNRLTVDMEKHFLEWAIGLSAYDLQLVWYSIDFKRKMTDNNGYYDQLENPDTTNGNLKFWFVYKGNQWKIIE